ncbi:MAG: sugar-binding protein, partial [Merismopedia sp. SIO2A8]|nr:sugar-binding protein [Merismopedia sp. SIO2A8]
MNNEHKKVMNENTLQALSWALKASQGRFSLILARCNYASLRRQMVQQLQSQLLEGASLVLTEITLHKSVKKLFATLKNQLGQKQPQALMVFGLESLSNLEQVLTAANQVREEFGKHFHFPLVLWVTDEVMRRLIRLAPDFYSWATSVEFAITTDDLIKFIEQTADAVVAKVLDAGAGIFLDNTALNLEIGSPLRTELESARQELITRGARLNRKQEASLEFIIGRELDNLQQDARQHYERSLALW